MVNGTRDVIGNQAGELADLIARSPVPDATSVRIEAATASIAAGSAPAGGADVWLVRYDPRILEVPIGRGENGGRTLPHRNVVKQLARLGSWTGQPRQFALPPAPSPERLAVLVQQRHGGPILAAATK